MTKFAILFSDTFESEAISWYLPLDPKNRQGPWGEVWVKPKLVKVWVRVKQTFVSSEWEDGRHGYTQNDSFEARVGIFEDERFFEIPADELFEGKSVVWLIRDDGQVALLYEREGGLSKDPSYVRSKDYLLDVAKAAFEAANRGDQTAEVKKDHTRG